MYVAITFGSGMVQSTLSVTRSGGLITLTGSGSSGRLPFRATRQRFPKPICSTRSHTIQNTGTLSEVELDPVSGAISVYINWTALVNGCSQAANTGQGQSAPAPVITDSGLPLPSPSPSASPSPDLQISELSYGTPAPWTHFVIDSKNNVYMSDLNGNGVVETSPTGVSTGSSPEAQARSWLKTPWTIFM